MDTVQTKEMQELEKTLREAYARRGLDFDEIKAEEKKAPMLRFDLEKVFETACEKGVDWNGHFTSGKMLYNPNEVRADTFFMRYNSDTFDYDAETREFTWHGVLEIPSMFSDRCSNCGEKLVFCFDGEKVWVKSECEYPDGLPTFDVKLNVPSGKMVVANDLRDKFPINGSFDVNMNIGIKETMMEYEKIGMAHGFVGNTCPGVFKFGDKLAIGCKPDEFWDEEKEEYTEKDPVPLIHKDEESVAGVCTDLWWYSIVDYDDFVRRYGREPGDYEEVVDVTPGQYLFKHQYHRIDTEDYHNTQVFCNIERIGDVVIDKDIWGDWLKLDYSAECMIANMMDGKWGGHEYKLDNPEHVVRMIDNYMCHCLRHGVHPNGWIRGRGIGIDPSLHVDLPEIKEAYDWNELRDRIIVYDDPIPAMAYGREKFNDSHIRLGFNVLQSMIRYEVKMWFHPDDTDEIKDEKKKERKDMARKFFDMMVERYPNLIPDYCKDLVEN